MTIYFFVGSEFSSNTDFSALNQGAEQLKKSGEKVIFLSANENIENIKSIAISLENGDVIIGASAGGGAAASLVKEVISLGKPKPIVIGFEALGNIGEIEGVISIVQADNPKQINYNNHCMYQLLDGTYQILNGTKRYVYGHAFYAVHPSFVKQLKYSPDSLTRIGNSDYVIIPSASLTVGSKTYSYQNLIARTNDAQSLDLAFTNSRVFQMELIHNIVNSAKQNTLEKDEILSGLRLKALNPSKKLLIQSSQKSEAKEQPENKISSVKEFYKTNEKIMTMILRLEKGSKSYLPYWVKSTKKLNAIINALHDIIQQNEDVNLALKDTNSALYKAIMIQRISFFKPETKSLKIINTLHAPAISSPSQT